MPVGRELWVIVGTVARACTIPRFRVRIIWAANTGTKLCPGPTDRTLDQNSGCPRYRCGYHQVERVHRRLYTTGLAQPRELPLPPPGMVLLVVCRLFRPGSSEWQCARLATQLSVLCRYFAAGADAGRPRCILDKYCLPGPPLLRAGFASVGGSKAWAPYCRPLLSGAWNVPGNRLCVSSEARSNQEPGRPQKDSINAVMYDENCTKHTEF